MARNYKMFSKFGEKFDMISDIVAHLFILYTMINVYDNDTNSVIIPLLLISFYLMNRWYGHVEALNNHNKFGNDNFLKTKKKSFSENTLFNKFYLSLVNTGYAQYRKEYKEFDKKKIYDNLNFLKHFSPGNIETMIFIIMLIATVKN